MNIMKYVRNHYVSNYLVTNYPNTTYQLSSMLKKFNIKADDVRFIRDNFPDNYSALVKEPNEYPLWPVGSRLPVMFPFIDEDNSIVWKGARVCAVSEYPQGMYTLLDEYTYCIESSDGKYRSDGIYEHVVSSAMQHKPMSSCIYNDI